MLKSQERVFHRGDNKAVARDLVMAAFASKTQAKSYAKKGKKTKKYPLISRDAHSSKHTDYPTTCGENCTGFQFYRASYILSFVWRCLPGCSPSEYTSCADHHALSTARCRYHSPTLPEF